MLEAGVCEGEPRLDVCLFLSGRQRCGVIAYCCDVFGQALGVVPGACLFFEVFDAIGVGVCGAGFPHGGFSALLLCFSGLLVCKAFAFRGFAAEADFLRDFGDLVFQRPVGEVGPFAGAVWAAASEDELQAVRAGVPRSSRMPATQLVSRYFADNSGYVLTVIMIRARRYAPAMPHPRSVSSGPDWK
ncbi:hypothetical protein ABZV61_31870 [Streptomyces sp900116325]|uniref:Uncharacterized protein n=1 Tax=Streptomyces sp. 900116325 TaxID=3154295 RepID=A0ABV2UHG2_9ACTN